MQRAARRLSLVPSPVGKEAERATQDAAIASLTARVEAAESQTAAVLTSLEEVLRKTESVTRALMSNHASDSHEKVQVQQTLEAVRALAVQAWVALESQG